MWQDLLTWMTTFVTDFTLRLSNVELALLLLNVSLLIFAGVLHRWLPQRNPVIEGESQTRLRIFRALNVLCIVLILGFNMVFPNVEKSFVIKVLAELMIIYAAYLSFHIMVYVIRRRFGRVKEVSGEMHLVDTYNSRLLELLSISFIIVIALIASIQLFEVDSLLEAGGVIGFIGVMLALTQASWAPDIIAGVIILNSRLFEESDVIQIKSGTSEFIGLVYKTRMFHTELLNLQNNHRVMIRNSQLRDMELHNLSKFASVRGLREMLMLKIGYDVPGKAVRAMVAAAFDKISNSQDNHVEMQFEFEVVVQDVADHAVHWVVFYHVKKVRHMLRTRQILREALLETSIEQGIALSTPALQQWVTTDAQATELPVAANK